LLDTSAAIDNFVPDFLGDDAILFSYTANIARFGNTPMYMHTDQITIQPPIRDVAFGMNIMYFLEDVTEENGGTLVMPGSHKVCLSSFTSSISLDDLLTVTASHTGSLGTR
jgi:ectoine hydroxylase-related dioxygenase (phytanoyl-CoA dioxygenase family)